MELEGQAGRVQDRRTGDPRDPGGLPRRRSAAGVEYRADPRHAFDGALGRGSEVEQPEIADLKPPASMRAELGPLWTGLAIVAALLAAAAVYWWMHRRYAARLAAAEVPDDPFHRTPPHVWVYGELQKLLEKRLPEQGEVDRFYAELGRILKRYLGGRFRVDLLEHTTAEVPGRLRQAGGAEPMIQKSREILAACDAVKFAGVRPDPEQCRLDVEKVYEIVDATKPREVREDAARGAA